MTRFQKYLKEDIDRIFVRLGPMSGQKQTHGGHKKAPAKKGIWLLPIQASRDLAFLGGFQDASQRLKLSKQREEELGKEWGDLDYSDFAGYSRLERKEKSLQNKKIKQHYRKIKLKPQEKVWCHLPGPSEKFKPGEGWNWYLISVGEYWKRFKKERRKYYNDRELNIGIDGEYFEIFWETT